MLLAPFSLIETHIRTGAARKQEPRGVPRWLQAWAIGGMVLLLLIPSLRGDNLSGMSVPFWLVAAPLINIVWISLTRWLALIRAKLAQFPLRRSASRRRR